MPLNLHASSLVELRITCDMVVTTGFVFAGLWLGRDR